MTRVLAILVDALRYDYVNQRDTPFIHGIAEEGHKLPLKPILGYSDSIRATIFTGAYPDKHGYWMSYCYSPETSPFKFLRSLSFVDYIPSDLIRRGIKFLLSSTIMRILARVFGYSVLHLHNIPFRIMDRFDMTLRKQMTDPNALPGYPTVFDVLREHGTKFAYLDSSKLRGRLFHEIAGLSEHVNFVFVYLHYLDQVSHWSGLKSPNFKKCLRAVDETVRDIISIVHSKFNDSFVVLLFSDHGMAEEHEKMDLEWLTRRGDFGRDFFLSLDATMIRVWYERQDRRQELIKLFSGIGGCRLLSESEKKELGIAFNNRLYGDDVFLFNEGQIVFPNFYSYIRPKAMHAYHPSCQSQQGIFIISGKEHFGVRPTKLINLVDIAPTILALFSLPIPVTCEGKCIVSWDSNS